VLFIGIIGLGFGYLFLYAGIKGDQYVLTDKAGNVVTDSNGVPVGVWRRPWMVLVDILTGGPGGELTTSAAAGGPGGSPWKQPTPLPPTAGGGLVPKVGSGLFDFGNWVSRLFANPTVKPGGTAPADPSGRETIGGQTYVPVPGKSPTGYVWAPVGVLSPANLDITKAMGAY
jgi:hypothetical protein